MIPIPLSETFGNLISIEFIAGWTASSVDTRPLGPQVDWSNARNLLKETIAQKRLDQVLNLQPLQCSSYLVMNTGSQARTHPPINLCTLTHAHKHTCIYTHTHICTHIHKDTHTCLCTNVCSRTVQDLSYTNLVSVVMAITANITNKPVTNTSSKVLFIGTN